MSKSNDFIKFIAYLQIIGIILVVFGHSFHEYPDGDAHGTSLLIYRLMYNFRMPLFMFVSGFLMYYTTFRRLPLEYPHPRKFILKKVKRLLLPYATLTLITYIPRAALSSIADDPISMSVSGVLRSLVITDELPIPFFWFIQASFLLLIVNYTIIYFTNSNRVPVKYVLTSLILLFILLPFAPMNGTDIFGYQYAIHLGIFFILGITYCEYYDRLSRILVIDSPIVTVISAAIWLALFYIGENTDIARIGSVFGIIMCISIAQQLVKHNLTFLDHLIGANYIIFLLSWYCNVACQQVLSHIITLPWWCYTILSIFSGIYVPWLFYHYMRKHQHIKTVRIASTLLGQSFKNNQK